MDHTSSDSNDSPCLSSSPEEVMEFSPSDLEDNFDLEQYLASSSSDDDMSPASDHQEHHTAKKKLQRLLEEIDQLLKSGGRRPIHQVQPVKQAIEAFKTLCDILDAKNTVQSDFYRSALNQDLVDEFVCVCVDLLAPLWKSARCRRLLLHQQPLYLELVHRCCALLRILTEHQIGVESLDQDPENLRAQGIPKNPTIYQPQMFRILLEHLHAFATMSLQELIPLLAEAGILGVRNPVPVFIEWTLLFALRQCNPLFQEQFLPDQFHNKVGLCLDSCSEYQNERRQKCFHSNLWCILSEISKLLERGPEIVHRFQYMQYIMLELHHIFKLFSSKILTTTFDDPAQGPLHQFPPFYDYTKPLILKITSSIARHLGPTIFDHFLLVDRDIAVQDPLVQPLFNELEEHIGDHLAVFRPKNEQGCFVKSEKYYHEVADTSNAPCEDEDEEDEEYDSIDDEEEMEEGECDHTDTGMITVEPDEEELRRYINYCGDDELEEESEVEWIAADEGDDILFLY